MKNEEIRNAKSFDELLDIKYGKVGEKERWEMRHTTFDSLQNFRIWTWKANKFINKLKNNLTLYHHG